MERTQRVRSVCWGIVWFADGPAAGVVAFHWWLKKTYKIGREGWGGRGGGGRDWRGEGRGVMTTKEWGLDDGVMCCFRANCFCDSGTTTFIAIGYYRELIGLWANEAACYGVWMGVFSFFIIILWFGLDHEKHREQMQWWTHGNIVIAALEHDVNYCLVITDASRITLYNRETKSPDHVAQGGWCNENAWTSSMVPWTVR